MELAPLKRKSVKSDVQAILIVCAANPNMRATCISRNKGNTMITLYEVLDADNKYCSACASYRTDPNKEKRYFVKEVRIGGGNTTQERFCEDCLQELRDKLDKIKA